MALSDILSGIGQIVNTGTAAAANIRNTINTPTTTYTTCSYPDGTVIKWPTTAGPCPQRNPNQQYTTGEILGVLLIFGAVGLLIIFILNQPKR